MKINFDFKTTMEFDVRVLVDGFTPAQTAKVVYNHDDPRYGDSDIDADFEMFTCFFVFNYKGKEIKIPFPDELYNIVEDKIYEEIYEEGEDAIAREYCRDRYEA